MNPVVCPYDYLVVLDFEATCDEGLDPVVSRSKVIQVKLDLTPQNNQEIIEFPWVVINTTTNQIENRHQLYVKPEFTQYLTPFCTGLTGITNEILADKQNLQCVFFCPILQFSNLHTIPNHNSSRGKLIVEYFKTPKRSYNDYSTSGVHWRHSIGW
eukprot:TRINITY_DN16733_c0_g4_i7.p1 TRINITY_DN16733_c0_g4~~TRINITY_DN16733_c0_g4_i7.p1  ORF type:complete len:156 (-),score=14.73 TRINITY_DN16733_c0_g4_i7:165-632(-)